MTVITSSPLDVTLAIEGKHPLTQEELFRLVNGFDGYESREGADERIVVDVKSVRADGTIVLHLFPQYKVTYAEVERFIATMIRHILEATGLGSCSYSVVEIVWHIEELGVPSEVAPIHVDSPLEEAEPSAPRFRLEPGRSYYVEERRNERGLAIFADHLHHGFHGLLVTRLYPEHVRAEHGLHATPIVWLSRTEHKDENLRTDNLHVISDMVQRDILGKHERAIVLIDGLEYLATHSGFTPVLKFVQYLVDVVALKRGVLLFSLNPKAFGPQELNLLTREMIRFEE
jgi:hypothetical protein